MLNHATTSWAAVAWILCTSSAFLARAAETPRPYGNAETRRTANTCNR